MRTRGVTASEILERLGGRDVVRSALLRRSGKELSAKAVEMWERRGVIPSRWHFDLLGLAEERGASLSLHELSMTSRNSAVAA